MKALHALKASAEKGGVPSRTLLLVELRASQINGCSVCVDMHARELRKVLRGAGWCSASRAVRSSGWGQLSYASPGRGVCL